jgi:hypothetical protein
MAIPQNLSGDDIAAIYRPDLPIAQRKAAFDRLKAADPRLQQALYQFHNESLPSLLSQLNSLAASLN